MTTPISADEPLVTTVRFAVRTEGDTHPPSKFTITEDPDGLIKFSVSSDDEKSAQNIVKIASAYTARTALEGEPQEPRLAIAAKFVQASLEEQGYDVKEMPLSDVRVSAAFDLRTGKMVGRQESMHDLLPIDDSIAERINNSILEVFKKGPLDLAVEINSLVQKGDHEGAAAAVIDGRSGMGFFGALPVELLESLEKIDVVNLSNDSVKIVREIRMAVAANLNRYDLAASDAQFILSESLYEGVEERASLENVIAVACVRRGEVETAISMWRKILKSSDVISPIDRAWVYRNLSKALPAPNAIKYASLSVDAFLEAGDKHEAASTLMLLSKLLEHEGPAPAIEQLNKMLVVINDNGLMEDALRSSIHHSLASRLYSLRNYTSALNAALKAVSLLRGLIGAERELVSSLNLASVIAKHCADEELSQKLEAESRSLEKGSTREKLDLARRIQKLFDSFDSYEAIDICSEAEKSGDSDLIAAAEVATATLDTAIDSIDKIRRLEVVVNRLVRELAPPEARYPAMSALVMVLKDAGELERAEIWLRRILSEMPLNLNARDQLLQILWGNEAWGDAAIFTEHQIKLHGDLPSLLYAHGKSLLEAGDVSGALSAFMRALKKVESGSALHTTILSLREKALELGGTIQSITRPLEIPEPILREKFTEALCEFAAFISSEKRMGFWYKPEINQEYKWVVQPERRAQDLLHTFLKARFLDRISIFEELDTGAGRLDIYLKLDGGLSIVVELKMCGFGYSSTYAADGEGQIQHYMSNRKSHIGYLVVFDSRLNKNMEALLSGVDQHSQTICEVFVDVRPRVSEKKSRGNPLST
ncbi:hypothetical protein JFU49_04970 [Pseudomonas sp. TH03]|uniref:hypothetical protein n=1 Tax=Pseudomonas sp. TH03 TaxID=2796369 RepID=UPI001913FB11|nr:hypothetical protein [Pseudomonas sp. TH03]MBK5549639.1 hypothetical protein [Pseudomonas sp. TH03]